MCHDPCFYCAYFCVCRHVHAFVHANRACYLRPMCARAIITGIIRKRDEPACVRIARVICAPCAESGQPSPDGSRRTLPYPTLPYRTVPYLTLLYLTLPYLTLPCLTLQSQGSRRLMAHTDVNQDRIRNWGRIRNLVIRPPQEQARPQFRQVSCQAKMRTQARYHCMNIDRLLEFVLYE